ncbi:CoA-binding protein [Desulfovibrio inopinatus]|uniref:CoA-binding protein n=1 Tax=Desulfovibrio inopinatus TaxID=102109 RepID=UPI0004117405|nr:CoA-binding protein [Desulfovibrio inopinatus]
MLYSEMTVRDILTLPKTVAIIGAKDKAGQPVDMVGRYLISAGFRVLPVHPVRKGVWGLTTYTHLAEIKEPIDIVNVFRAAAYCPDHAREVLDLPTLPQCFWMQSGIRSADAEGVFAGTKVHVIEDRCIMVEHRRLLA